MLRKQFEKLSQTSRSVALEHFQRGESLTGHEFSEQPLKSVDSHDGLGKAHGSQIGRAHSTVQTLLSIHVGHLMWRQPPLIDQAGPEHRALNEVSRPATHTLLNRARSHVRLQRPL